MLQLMEKGQEWYNLAGAQSWRAKLTLQWKPVALSGVGAGTGGYVTPIGVLRFHFINARDLRNLETLGKSDPYVRVLLSGMEKGRTVTFQNNLNPDFDEVIYIPIHSTREKLTIEVMDQENMGSDRSLGLLEILAADYISQADNGEYLIHDAKKRQAGVLRNHGKGSPKGTLNHTVSFYPLLNIADPEEEKEEVGAKEEEAEPLKKKSSERGRISLEMNGKKDSHIDADLATKLAEGEKEQEETTEVKTLPKIRLSPEELLKYESGLIIFKLMDVELTESDVHVEVLMDDMVFPSYSSSTIRSKKSTLDEIGDCFVRELDFSKITLRIREKGKNKGDNSDHNDVVAKLTGDTLITLKQCLNNPTVLQLKAKDGGICKIKVSLKYIPVNMRLDPSESINNMGKLRVDVLDAKDLPAADRNGYSDPYCKFELNGKEVFKTKTQKKTLHPAWNEFFEVDVASRVAADFVCDVFDYDFGDKADHLGKTKIPLGLLEPFTPQEYNLNLDGKSGSIRLRLLFKPTYVTRSRQGSSTFSGTFATPGKIVTGVAGVPFKGVGLAAHGVGKGASFIKRGFKSKTKDDPNGIVESDEVPVAPVAPVANNDSFSLPKRGTSLAPPDLGNNSPISQSSSPSHTRTKSQGASSMHSTMAGFASTGTASFTILSASGYPPSSNVMVIVKQLGGKGKTVHKTDHIKSPSGTVTFNDKKESFKTSCSADTQFQIQVKGHNTFGSDDDLGEGLIFVDESGTGLEKQVKAGSGQVTMKSNFVLNPEVNGPDSPNGKGVGAFRRSMLSKRGDPAGRTSREVTPTPP